VERELRNSINFEEPRWRALEGRRPAAGIDIKDYEADSLAFPKGGPGTLPDRAKRALERADGFDPTTDPRRRAQVARQRAEMEQAGIPKAQQRRALGPLGLRKGLSERIYESVAPMGYGRPLERLGEILRGDTSKRDRGLDVREDAWRLYLGLPQAFGTVEISPYTPPSSQDLKAVYYRIKNSPETEAKFVKKMLRFERAQKDLHPDRTSFSDYDTEFQLFTAFISGRGTDVEGEYFSYYDFWDMDVPVHLRDLYSALKSTHVPEKVRDSIVRSVGSSVKTYERPGGQPLTTLPLELVAGSPIEFYDRIHFDRTKFERILDLEDELIAQRDQRTGYSHDPAFRPKTPYGATFRLFLADALDWARGHSDEEIRARLAELETLSAEIGAPIVDVSQRYSVRPKVG